MFCSGAIVFRHYTECPFYVAYAQIITELPVVIRPREVLSKQAEECRRRCKEDGGIS